MSCLILKRIIIKHTNLVLSVRAHPLHAQLAALLEKTPDGLSASDIEQALTKRKITVPSRPTLLKHLVFLIQTGRAHQAGRGRAVRYFKGKGDIDTFEACDEREAREAREREELLQPKAPGKTTFVLGDNLDWLATQPDGSVDLIYIDPPFNTGKKQSRAEVRAIETQEGGSLGFGGKRYVRETVGDTQSYNDRFDDFIEGFLGPRVREAYRLLSPNGSLFLHLDPRESHYAKVFLDQLFGRASFRNEIIWSYDYGARSRDRWSSKHDTILWYSKNHKAWTFNYEAIDRIPYMAPGLVGAEKAERGKTPTDVWWNTIVSPTGKEKTGYPTQKPLAILERIVLVHSHPEDKLLDFFAGSGSFGHAAAKHGRGCMLVDENPQARDTIRKRFQDSGLPLTEDKIKKKT